MHYKPLSSQLFLNQRYRVDRWYIQYMVLLQEFLHIITIVVIFIYLHMYMYMYMYIYVYVYAYAHV